MSTTKPKRVNLSDLIATVAKENDISKAQAQRVVNSTFAAIAKGLKQGARVSLGDIGAMQTTKRKARKARNPATGEAMKIPARKVVKFRASSKLKL